MMMRKPRTVRIKVLNKHRMYRWMQWQQTYLFFAITVTDYLFLACMLTVQCVHDARHYIQHNKHTTLTAACLTFDTTLEFSFSCLYSSSSSIATISLFFKRHETSDLLLFLHVELPVSITMTPKVSIHALACDVCDPCRHATHVLVIQCMLQLDE